MDLKDAAAATRELLADYVPSDPAPTAAALRVLWLGAVPLQPPGLEPEQEKLRRDLGLDDSGYESAGVPVPVLTAVGQEIGKVARKQVTGYLPLVRLLWGRYGREGRIVAAVGLGPMELADPELVVPEIYDMAQTCVSWEDCDQLSMKALEPVMRRDPDNWLERMGTWVTDDVKWVQRAGLTAIGRLAMVQAEYTSRCVDLLAPALGDGDRDVKRALSFALRLSARGEVGPVKGFVQANKDVTDADSVWVLCDVIRSGWKVQLPEFADLLPIYQAWLETAEPQARRSVQSAVRTLERVQP